MHNSGMRQLTFPGLGDAPVRESHNLFFALWPSDSVRVAIEAAAGRLRQEHQPAGRWIARHRYHMTLHYLGNHDAVPQPLADFACAAGGRVRAAAFDVPLDTAASFSNNKQIPWWLGCHETPPDLRALWRAIRKEFGETGQRALRNAALIPHVTILRDAVVPLPPTPIPPIRWPVSEFVLIDSVLGSTPSYQLLGRWPLKN